MTDADFTAFYREHSAALFRTVRRWLFSAHDAEEVTNDAFRIFHRALPKFRGECSHRSFLYKIGVNLAHNRYDRNCRRRYYSNLSLEADTETGIPISETVAAPHDDQVAFYELDRSVRAGLDHLAPMDRDIIELYADTEMDCEALSTALAIPIGTVKSRLARARGKLRKVMGVAA